MNLDDIKKALLDGGVVGAGGAGFPTYAKLSDQAETIILNAAECEPFITSDHRGMLEDAQNIIDGMKLIMEYIGLDEAYVGIEANKPDAIKKLKKGKLLNRAFSALVSDETYDKILEEFLGKQD